MSDAELERLARVAYEINLDIYAELTPVGEQWQPMARQLALAADTWETCGENTRSSWRMFVRRFAPEVSVPTDS